jgi:hypothetical protein
MVSREKKGQVGKGVGSTVKTRKKSSQLLIKVGGRDNCANQRKGHWLPVKWSLSMVDLYSSY